MYQTFFYITVDSLTTHKIPVADLSETLSVFPREFTGLHKKHESRLLSVMQAFSLLLLLGTKSLLLHQNPGSENKNSELQRSHHFKYWNTLSWTVKMDSPHFAVVSVLQQQLHHRNKTSSQSCQNLIYKLTKINQWLFLVPVCSVQILKAMAITAFIRKTVRGAKIRPASSDIPPHSSTKTESLH